MHRLITTILAIALSLTPGICKAQNAAANVADSLVGLLSALDDGEEKLLLLDKISYSQNSADSCIKYAELENELAKKLGNKELQSASLAYLSWSYHQKGKYLLSIAFSYKALGLCDNLNGSLFVGGIYNLLSYNYYSLGEFFYADEFSRKAMDCFVEMGATEYIADTYRTLGLFCIEYHFFDLGREYIEKSKNINNNLSEIGYCDELTKLAYCDYLEYFSAKNSDSLLYSSINLYSKAYKYAMEHEMQPELIELLPRMALAYAKLASIKTGTERKTALDSCYSTFNQGLRESKKLGYTGNVFLCEIAAAQYYILVDDPENTEHKIQIINEYFNSSEDRQKRYGENYYEAITMYYQYKKDYKTVCEYQRKSIIYNYQRYSYDLGSKLAKLKAEEDYEIFTERVDNEKIKRDKEFLARNKGNRKINKFLFVIIFFVIAIFIYVVISIIVQSALNKQLKLQSQNIQRQNEELDKQHTEFLELQAKFKKEQNELMNQRHKFKKATRYLHTSLLRAWDIQTSLIPNENAMEQIFGKCLLYWKPLQIVSGDFYWAQQTADFKILVTADCTGHGVPGAFMSMLGISTLNDIATNRNMQNSNNYASDIMENMRTKIINSLHQNSSENEQYDAIDMSICVVSKHENKLQYCGANRPLWIAGKDGIRSIEADEISTGIDLLGFQKFTNHEIEFEPGEVLYTFSDGITDQFGGKNGKMKFGSKRLKMLLNEIKDLDFDIQYQKLELEKYNWTTQTIEDVEDVEIFRPQLDDQLVIGIKV